MCAPSTGKNIGTSGSCMSFDACESRSLIHSVPRPSVGIAGAELDEMSYLIDNLLFRELIMLLKVASAFQFQLFQLIFW